MKMMIVLGSVVAMTLSAAAPYAQQQPAPTTTPAHNVFVLTGCLMADAKATAAFKLTDASSNSKTSPAGTAIPGAVGTSGLKESYELRPVSGVGAQGIDADGLKAHVGHRVEVVVRPIETPGPAPAPTSGAVGAAKPTAPAPERYNVTAIKRTVGRCS
jgi:hypothetical protein